MAYRIDFILSFSEEKPHEAKVTWGDISNRRKFRLGKSTKRAKRFLRYSDVDWSIDDKEDDEYTINTTTAEFA